MGLIGRLRERDKRDGGGNRERERDGKRVREKGRERRKE